MDTTRQLLLNKNSFNGKSVLYVMSRDQRVYDNHALLTAQALAIEHKVPLYVLFVLKKVENRSREHYRFMLDGLFEVADTLKSLNIPFVMRIGNAATEILDVAQHAHAGAIFFDFNPLPGSRKLARRVAKDFAGTVSVVDAHNSIPVWVVSTKQEFAAHTMRGKVHKLLGEYITEPTKIVTHPVPTLKLPGASFKEAQNYITTIPACGISVTAVPGEKAARTRYRP